MMKLNVGAPTGILIDRLWNPTANDFAGAWNADAVITFTLKNSAGVDVTGAITISCPYVGTATYPGRYLGWIAKTVSLTALASYTLYVTVDSQDAYFIIPCIAQNDTAGN